MHNNFFAKCISVIISSLILFSYAPASAEDTGNASSVRIIVELEDKPLLSYETKIQTYSAVGEYVNSDEGQRLENALAAERNSFKKSVAKIGIDADIEREYSAVLNGVSIRTQETNLDRIKQLDGVKNAFVEGCRELIRPMDSSIYTSDSVPSIGGDIVGEDLGYTGKGTAIAIIDTGLYTNHEAFTSVNSPKYTVDDIDAIIKSSRLAIGKTVASEVYISDKIPYAFDYADFDTNVSGGESHGTHVAGIAAANNVIRGVAPDAQLLIMKVFGDNRGGAYDSDILSALDDSIKLGADTINMSLGSDSGFSEDADASMREVYDRISASGIALYCAGGNSYSSARNNAAGNNLPKASEPDNGIVSAPSTYDAALSVASMNNVKITSEYISAGDKKIRYADAAQRKSQKLSMLNGSFEYVDCNIGAAADFENVDVSGKIALIKRGGSDGGTLLTFANKENNARLAGAAAAVIYDNVSGVLANMSTDCKIPCVFISKADGEYLLSLDNKSMTVNESQIESFVDEYSGKMSDFSSWGTTLDLRLKPEITAPGGNIYSSLPGNLYGSMSGTSMAAPHMAGAGAVMEQYINEQLEGEYMTAKERSALSAGLMMSTAVPLCDEYGRLYSPRKQGAGLVQLDKAVTAGAYLTSSKGENHGISMGFSADGEFNFAFNINCLSDHRINYNTSVTVITEDTVTENGETYMAQYSRELEADEFIAEIPDTVSAVPDRVIPIRGKINLTERGKKRLLADFENGIYIEGFITLTPAAEDDVVLSCPFLGFFGNWNAVPVFDSDIYDDKSPSMCETELRLVKSSTGAGRVLGINSYTDNGRADKNKIAIRGGDASRYVAPTLSLLRNAETINFSAHDSGGSTVYSETFGYAAKTTYSSDGYSTVTPVSGWLPYDKLGSPLPDGEYTYTVTTLSNGEKQYLSYPVVIDSTAPEIVSSTVSGSEWTLYVHDNHYIQAMCISDSAQLTEWIEPQAENAGAVAKVTYDLNSAEFDGIKQAQVVLIDYAGNKYTSDYIDLEEEKSMLSYSAVKSGEGCKFKVSLGEIPYASKLITVLFENEVMTGIKMTEITPADSGADIDIDVDAPAADKAKVFIWSDEHSMLPLCNMASFEIE